MGGTGSSWSDAFRYLQDVLTASQPGDEIWVASGAYYLDDGAGISNVNRLATFELRESVALYGGFTGDETTLASRQRNPAMPTILSGDTTQDDRNLDGNRITETISDHRGGLNNIHVVTGSGVSANTVVDGFVITGGFALASENRNGAGLTITDGSPTFANCWFAGSRAFTDGGAVFLTSSDSSFTNYLFSGNRASDDGGACYILDSNPTFTNCTFTNNTAGDLGGALYNTGGTSQPSFPIIRNSILWGNTSGGPNALDESVSNRTGSWATFSYSIIAHSGGSAAWTPADDIDAGNNLDRDPRFIAPGSAQLHADSPAIDSGDRTRISQLTDIAGLPRITDGNFDASAIIDMGAHEYSPSNTDSDGDGFLDSFEQSVAGSPIALGFPTSEAGFTVDGGDVFPTFTYHYDARLENLGAFTVEHSSDLGRASQWTEMQLLPVDSAEEGGLIRVTLRAPFSLDSTQRSYFRLRVSY